MMGYSGRLLECSGRYNADNKADSLKVHSVIAV